MKEFDYYIFIDFSGILIGYNIIEKSKIQELLPKISRFRHYKGSFNRKIYLKHIKNFINKANIKSYFKKTKIKEVRNNMEIFIDILEFIKTHNDCIIFISIDDYQYRAFRKIVKLTDGNKTKIVKESLLKKNSKEYRLSLVIDNLLNIERRKRND